MRLTMEQTNAAYIEWINDECEKRIQVHLDKENELERDLNTQKEDYEKKILNLNSQIEKLNNDIEVSLVKSVVCIIYFLSFFVFYLKGTTRII